MKKNCKTYELFTVAKLILQKPERFVVTVRRKENSEGVIPSIYLSLLDDIAFESEKEAMAYIIKHHLEEFFDVIEEEVEAPKGRFMCVHRCGVTGKLLSAPNYHKYNSILREHFSSEIRTMSFERFVSKIETTKEEEDIQNWIKQMTKRLTYKPKPISEEGVPLEALSSLEEVKEYLLKYYKERILREVTTVRITGVNCKNLPISNLSHSVEYFLQKQRQFPLDTANNLRNRLRRAGFTVYRKGKNGITYTCAVKRKFRSDGDVFEDKIQSLITFLDDHSLIKFEDLKKAYIDVNCLDESEVSSLLNWLIHEGYVVAYEDGKLFLNPKLDVSKPEENEKSLDDSGDKDQSSTDKESVLAKDDVIILGMQETAIEKRSDGTLLVSDTEVVKESTSGNNLNT